MYNKYVHLFLICTVYFLFVAVFRKYLYSGRMTSISYVVQCAVVFVPLCAGLYGRKLEWISASIIAAGMTPGRFPILILFTIVPVAAIIQILRKRDLVRPELRAWALFGIFLFYLVILGVIRHRQVDVQAFAAFYFSGLSIPLSFVLLFAFFSWSKEKISAFAKLILVILLAQGTMVLLYPLIIGNSSLYIVGINGLLKGVDALFGLALYLPYKNPDGNCGSMVHAHYLGFAMIILAAWMFVYGMMKRNKLLILGSFGFAYAYGMTETAQALPGIATGIFVVTILFIPALSGYRVINKSIIRLLTISLLTVMPALIHYVVYESLPHFKDTRKALFVRTAVEHAMQNPLDVLIGYGPGTFGSRAANIRLPLSYGRVTAGPKYHMLSENVLPQYAEVLSKCSSGIQGYTAETEESGLVSLPFELGLIGTILLLGILIALLNSAILLFFSTEDVFIRSVAVVAVFTIILMQTLNVYKQAWELIEILFIAWPLMMIPHVWHIRNAKQSKVKCE
jgi:hypothetical protein